MTLPPMGGKQTLLYPIDTNADLIVEGNVVVGTIAPEANLDIVGSIRIADGTEGTGKVLASDANGLVS